VNGRQADTTERAARELASETGQPVLAVPGDVGVAGEAERLVERVAHELGRVDVVFCNSGGPPAAPFRDQPLEAW
jgi:3-oxoacyl-[acyl-carrier protein] reductase